MKKKVFIGMSGGVDSSLSAAMLKKSGYNVTGVFIKTWHPDWIKCNWREERRCAYRVAAELNIKCVTLDLESLYKNKIAKYIVEEYREGRTPNPDVLCNKIIKFGAFYNYALKQGADFVATGHYAQIKNGEMCMSADKDKDQTYFLWDIKSNILGNIKFPIGGFNKIEVRRLAKKYNISSFNKKDSQGICFLGQVDIEEFLTKEIKLKTGNVVNEKGDIIGSHKGAEIYTIGQRHGFDILKTAPNSKPMYVIKKDVQSNTITASSSDLKNNRCKTIKLVEINLLSKISNGENIQYRIRHRGTLHSGSYSKGEVHLSPHQPEYIQPGQSLVMYRGELCLGGGIIESVI